MKHLIHEPHLPNNEIWDLSALGPEFKGKLFCGNTIYRTLSSYLQRDYVYVTEYQCDWVEDADEWYAAELARQSKNAPA